MGYLNPLTGPITVAGGTITTVTGSVGSVTAPVTPDPASSIAAVTASVPFPFRDAFFWPALSGESFPPTLTTSGYSTANGGPAYSCPSDTAQTAGRVTFANIPRIGFNGKTKMTLTTSFVVGNVLLAGRTLTIGFGRSISAKFAYLRLSSSAAGTWTAALVTQAGSQNFPGTLAAGSVNTMSVVLNDDGTVSVTLNGATLTTGTADWPKIDVAIPFPCVESAGGTVSGAVHSIGSIGVGWS